MASAKKVAATSIMHAHARLRSAARLWLLVEACRRNAEVAPAGTLPTFLEGLACKSNLSWIATFFRGIAGGPLRGHYVRGKYSDIILALEKETEGLLDEIGAGGCR